MRQILKGALLLILAAAASADDVMAEDVMAEDVMADFKVGDIQIAHPWARASMGAARAGAAYMTLTNAGSRADRLVAAATEVAAAAELHTHLMEEGVMRMRQVAAIEVAPGAATRLEPGGLHVMLFGLKAPLAAGESFPLTLTFERAGEVTVEVGVQALGEVMPGHGQGHGQVQGQGQGQGHDQGHDEGHGHGQPASE